ncbi:MAG: transporter associated domain-containing protein [Halothiobacillaceae bacterium]|jgi:magnesium and cobalt transporter|nr:transporter associated domain-containing protein [Halothiobacillaceae bacterium]MDY0050307.1 transporter associated domain-containing protein [Halothiobacillaceae bacterium]
MDEPSSRGSGARNWLERIGQALMGEPRSREDLIEILKTARDRGLLEPAALGMIEGALEFHDLRARDIMVPRGQMETVNRDDSLEKMLRTVVEAGHSRYPVLGENRDEVVGVLLSKDLLRHFASSDASFDMARYMRPVAFVPESKRLDSLLAEFRVTRNHMAVVVDEFGGVAGLVTIEDVLEQIVGDIDDEYDVQEQANIRRQAANRYAVRALTPIEEFNETLGTQFSDEEYDTIGGLVTRALGHLPRRGETVILERFEFKVVGADKRRLHLLLVTELPQADAAVDDAA